ncbi:MAG TPA: hypothetical protein VKB08_13410, partial [Bradyrhizobium sp.]|nr:hypothetical protein [Bradyrhizobium sp.]
VDANVVIAGGGKYAPYPASTGAKIKQPGSGGDGFEDRCPYRFGHAGWQRPMGVKNWSDNVVCRH